MTSVEPKVSQLKFDREVARMGEQRVALESRGIFVLGTPAFPKLDVLYIPRHPLRTTVPAAIAGGLALPQGTVPVAELPSLSARAFKARFDLSDYDLRAPSLEFRDPWSDELLTYGTMFRAIEYEAQRKQHVVLLDDHPITHKPFLCIRGIREYHEHPQHSGDEWLLYRKDMGLFAIVLAVWRVCIDLIHPLVIYQPDSVQVNFSADEKV